MTQAYNLSQLANNLNTTGQLDATDGLVNAVPAANGGTGQSTYAIGDILYASGTTSLAKLSDIATGNVLISGGVGTAPSYGKVGLTTHVSGTLGVANGGTGAASFTSNNVLLGNGTGALQVVAPGTSGNVLTSNGTTWVSSASTANIVTSTTYATNTTHTITISGTQKTLVTMSYSGGNSGYATVYCAFQWGLTALSDTRIVTNATIDYQVAFTPSITVAIAPTGSTSLLLRINTTNLDGGFGSPSTMFVTVMQF
jgi:hypothetical protein